jgi:glutamyl-tRNA reductase
MIFKRKKLLLFLKYLGTLIQFLLFGINHKTAELILKNLLNYGVKGILVANRTYCNV